MTGCGTSSASSASTSARPNRAPHCTWPCWPGRPPGPPRPPPAGRVANPGRPGGYPCANIQETRGWLATVSQARVGAALAARYGSARDPVPATLTAARPAARPTGRPRAAPRSERDQRHPPAQPQLAAQRHPPARCRLPARCRPAAQPWLVLRPCGQRIANLPAAPDPFHSSAAGWNSPGRSGGDARRGLGAVRRDPGGQCAVVRAARSHGNEPLSRAICAPADRLYSSPPASPAWTPDNTGCGAATSNGRQDP